ncbi:MAG TPA: type II CAAX endopeptidase family protein [Beijerinckia sp.]|jgi:membrane protease YdiL (CAAX protease family)|nr:type II CAAX endopeptidase family protein [Beijerinckia sp.]
MSATGGLDEAPEKAKPYGPLGLCVSLAAILLLAAVLCMFTTGAFVLIDMALDGSALTKRIIRILRGALDGGVAPSANLELAFSFLVYAAVALAVILVARFAGGRDFRTLIAWRPWGLWQSDRWCWLIAGGALLYSFAADFALAYFYPQSDAWFTMPQNRFSAMGLVVLAVVFAPISEELVFRGWIYTSLRASFGYAFALFSTSALFAFLHYEHTHLYALAVFPIGLALGAIRERTGSIKASMSFHAFYNFVACCLSFADFG